MRLAGALQVCAGAGRGLGDGRVGRSTGFGSGTGSGTGSGVGCGMGLLCDSHGQLWSWQPAGATAAPKGRHCPGSSPDLATKFRQSLLALLVQSLMGVVGQVQVLPGLAQT